MSWECSPCHKVATGLSGEDRHFRPQSRGNCETCGKNADCFHCQCAGEWGKARIAAGKPG